MGICSVITNSVNRERTPFVYTVQMYAVMGNDMKNLKFQKFSSLFTKSLKVIRGYGSLIMALYQLVFKTK